jgi:hypothetical protein
MIAAPRVITRLVVIVASVAVAATCGGSGKTGDGAPGSGAAPSAAAPASSSSVKPVPHEQLQALLPTLPGWTRGEMRGETVAEDAISRAQADYEKGMSGLSFQIMDTAMNKDLLAQAEAKVRGGTSIGGFPAFEEWTAEAKNGEIQILVGGRFTVAVTGSSVDDLTVIRKAVEVMDLKKLAALK